MNNTHYWTKDVDDAIVEYRTTKSDKLFNEKILGPLTTLAESIYHRNGYSKQRFAEHNDIKECLTHCLLAFDRFDSTKEVATNGVIGFHYFSIVARHFYINKFQRKNNYDTNHVSLDVKLDNDTETENVLFEQIKQTKDIIDTSDTHAQIDSWYDIFNEFVEWTKTTKLTEKDKLIIKHFVDVIHNDKCAKLWKGGKGGGLTNMLYDAVMAENNSFWPMHTGTNSNKQVMRNYIKRLANKFLYEKANRQNDLKLRSSRLA